MPRSKKLVSVNGDWPLFGDAGADTVRAFDRLGPHAAEPGSPVFESARVCFVTAVFDRDACRITEEQRVSRLANELVEPIDLLLRGEDQLVERILEFFELVRRQDARRLAAIGVDAVLVRRSLPGGRYLLDTPSGGVPLRDPIDVLGVPYGHFDRKWWPPHLIRDSCRKVPLSRKSRDSLGTTRLALRPFRSRWGPCGEAQHRAIPAFPVS